MLLYSTGPVPLHYKQEEYRSPSTVTTLPVLQVEAVQQILVLLLYILYLYTCTTSRRRTAVLVLYSTCTLALQVEGVQQSQYFYYTLPVHPYCNQKEYSRSQYCYYTLPVHFYCNQKEYSRSQYCFMYSTCTLVLQIEGVQQILVLLLWIFLILFQQFLLFLIREET